MEIDWERIESFVGFGRRDAPVVFIGMEEGLSEEESLENDLVHRSQFAPVMDLKIASRGIAGTRKWFDLAIVQCQRTWRPMCDLMLRREGVSAPTKDERNIYQARRLGRSDGDTLLAELLPYPNTRSSRWNEIYKQRFPNRHQYRSQMSRMRIELLRQVLSETDRTLVVCYGKGDKYFEYWGQYEQLFREGNWSWHSPFRVTQLGVTRVVLAPHFVTRSFNSDVDLAAFARAAGV